ncbi:MAG: hypothetical protein ACFFGZ_01035 [Candidatus Thorarchaeota archaeon]
MRTRRKPCPLGRGSSLYQKPAYGAFAEYVCIPEKRLRLKPATMSFEEAATIPQAGVLAVQGIKGKTPPNPGHKVLINGDFMVKTNRLVVSSVQLD